MSYESLRIDPEVANRVRCQLRYGYLPGAVWWELYKLDRDDRAVRALENGRFTEVKDKATSATVGCRKHLLGRPLPFERLLVHWLSFLGMIL